MKNMRKIFVSTLVVLLLVAGLAPSVNASITGFHPFQTKQLNTKKEENHPQYYNITIYRFNGLTYKKTVKTITYEEALEIEEKFKNIDQGFDNLEDKINKELKVLMEYNILNKKDRDNNIQTTTTTMSSSKPSYKDFYPQPIIGGGNITAKLGPNGNIGVFTPFSAFFISIIGVIAANSSGFRWQKPLFRYRSTLHA